MPYRQFVHLGTGVQSGGELSRPISGRPVLFRLFPEVYLEHVRRGERLT